MLVFSALIALVLTAVPPLASDTWACASTSRSGFTTDPVVHPPHVTLAEIAAEMPAAAARSFEIHERDRVATVTHRNAGGLVVHQFEYSRGVDTGRQLERGRSCSGPLPR